MSEWLFHSGNQICDLRAVGLLVRDGKLLVQKERNGNEYALPGGHIRVGESTEEGLVREYMEETGAAIQIKRLLWTEECFWSWNGRSAHSIAFYYLIELCEGFDIPDSDEFMAHKDNEGIVLGWIPFARLSEITIYPSFVREEIDRLDGPIKHFVTRA